MTAMSGSIFSPAMIVKQRSRSRHGRWKQQDSHTLTGIRLSSTTGSAGACSSTARLLQYWGTLRRAGAWDESAEPRLSLHGRAISSSREPADRERIRVQVDAIAAEYPDVLGHARHVTALALSLFDQTASLHQLGPHERDLLEYAGLLHDIGWKYGQKGHSSRSRDMILRDERLPLDLPGRAVVGIAARAHRKGVMPEDDTAVFRPASSRSTVCCRPLGHPQAGRRARLSSLICGRRNRVLGHTGRNYPSLCRQRTDVSAERSRAQAKSDLLARAFGRTVEIR